MDEHLEHDDASALTRLVGQFRRLARLAAADPLRLLAAGPAQPLQSLSASVASLIAFAPFERLAEAVATPNPQAAAQAARPRNQSLAMGGTARAARGNVALAFTDGGPHTLQSRAIDGPGATNSQSRTDKSPTSARNTPLRASASAGLTLAERRVLARRQTSNAIASASAPSARPVALPTADHTVASIGALLRAATNTTKANGPTTASASAAPRVAPTDLEAKNARDPAPLSAAAGKPLLPSGVADLLAAIRAAVVADTPPVSPLPRAVVAGAAPGIAGLLTGAAQAAGRSVPAPNTPTPRGSTDTDQAVRTDRATRPDSPASVTDKLFETLYRSGVDLSWP